MISCPSPSLDPHSCDKACKAPIFHLRGSRIARRIATFRRSPVSASDRKVPAVLHGKNAESEAESRPHERCHVGRQLQHVCDHDDAVGRSVLFS
jgi:hypothetical protein